VFRLGNSTYGVDVKAVKRIVSIEGVVPVPRSTNSIIGLQIIRGAAVPIVSLAEVLSLAEPLELARQARTALVLAVGGVECGVAVERIDGVSDVRKAQLQPRSSDAEPAAIAGVYSAVGQPPQPVTLLSLEEISRRVQEIRIRKQ
jgi:purine-binding chemotaxis protein CheW